MQNNDISFISRLLTDFLLSTSISFGLPLSNSLFLKGLGKKTQEIVDKAQKNTLDELELFFFTNWLFSSYNEKELKKLGYIQSHFANVFLNKEKLSNKAIKYLFETYPKEMEKAESLIQLYSSSFILEEQQIKENSQIVITGKSEEVSLERSVIKSLKEDESLKEFLNIIEPLTEDYFIEKLTTDFLRSGKLVIESDEIQEYMRKNNSSYFNYFSDRQDFFFEKSNVFLMYSPMLQISDTFHLSSSAEFLYFSNSDYINRKQFCELESERGKKIHFSIHYYYLMAIFNSDEKISKIIKENFGDISNEELTKNIIENPFLVSMMAQMSGEESISTIYTLTIMIKMQKKIDYLFGHFDIDFNVAFEQEGSLRFKMLQMELIISNILESVFNKQFLIEQKNIGNLPCENISKINKYVADYIITKLQEKLFRNLL